MDDQSTFRQNLTPRTLTSNISAQGCAAKISAAELSSILSNLPKLPKDFSPNLIAGIENFEDAAVYKITEDLAIVATIDFFPPVVDDPYLYGRIAACNALSDIYAMGGKPVLALSVLCFPTCDFPLSTIEQILQGGSSMVLEAGAVVAGGHSIQTPEPVYGLSVMGLVDPQKMLTNCGAKAGDDLILTKAVGVGVLLLGLKGDVLKEETKTTLFSSVTQLNATALTASLGSTVHAATDVSGFGLIGHVHEMSLASNVRAIIDSECVPLLPQALDLASEGFVPAGAYQNRKSYEKCSSASQAVPLPVADLLYDPQTSGGLLFAVPASTSTNLVRKLNEAGARSAKIGRLVKGEAGQVDVLYEGK